MKTGPKCFTGRTLSGERDYTGARKRQGKSRGGTRTQTYPGHWYAIGATGSLKGIIVDGIYRRASRRPYLQEA